jgi:hypothetical protein
MLANYLFIGSLQRKNSIIVIMLNIESRPMGFDGWELMWYIAWFFGFIGKCKKPDLNFCKIILEFILSLILIVMRKIVTRNDVERDGN